MTTTSKRSSRRGPVVPFDRDRFWQEVPLTPSLPAWLERVVDTDEVSSGFVADAIARLDRHRRTLGGMRTIDHFLASAVGFGERCDRWATVRIIELADGRTDKGPMWPGWMPEVGYQHRRPLRPLELTATRLAAMRKLSPQEKGIPARCATVAVAEAGAVGGEFGKIFHDDLEFDQGTVVAVRLRGTMRENPSGFPIAVPRTVEIPRWARAVFTEFANTVTERDRPLLLRATSNDVDPHRIETALTNRVARVLEVAGHRGAESVTPASVRNGAARVAFERDGLDAAVARLGHEVRFVRSEIGLDPQRPARWR